MNDIVFMVITTWILVFILIFLLCFCFVLDTDFRLGNYSDCEIYASGNASTYTDSFGITRTKIGDTDISDICISTAIGNTSWMWADKYKLRPNIKFIVYAKHLIHGKVYSIVEDTDK